MTRKFNTRLYAFVFVVSFAGLFIHTLLVGRETLPAPSLTDQPSQANSDAAELRLRSVPLPRAPQVTGIPSPVPSVPFSDQDDLINVLLTGSNTDFDPTDFTYRTDSMIIVSINLTAHSVAMLSLPRDLLVYIPTLGMERISVAFGYGEHQAYQPGGGFGLLQQTTLYNFGIPIRYYAQISFTGFERIIDTLNGIDVAVDCPITDLRYQGSTDPGYTPQPSDYKPFTLSPGFYHMNGALALWYARMRHTTDDLDRGRRQQQVLRAIWQAARSQNMLNQLPDLWNQLSQIVKTNMTLADAMRFVPLALGMSPTQIVQYSMRTGREVLSWVTPRGEQMQLPDTPGFYEMIRQFYIPPNANRLQQASVHIQVYNGSGHEGWDKVAVDQLNGAGFAAEALGTIRDTAQTTVYDFTGGAQPALSSALRDTFHIPESAVQVQPITDRTADFKVVLGANYTPCPNGVQSSATFTVQ